MRQYTDFIGRLYKFFKSCYTTCPHGEVDQVIHATGIDLLKTTNA